MKTRCRWTMGSVLAVGLVLPLWGQAPKPAAAAKPWTAPKLPWGDPDLQGWYNNLQENGTPFERPNQFAGRQLEDVKGEELAAIKRATQARTIDNFQGPLHAPEHWWQDDLNLVKGEQAWFVVDPPDGKIPPLTPQATARSAARAAAARAAGRGPADSYTDVCRSPSEKPAPSLTH